MSNVTKLKQPAYMNSAMKNTFREVLTKTRSNLIAEPTIEIENGPMPDEIDIASMQEAAVLEMRRRERDATLIRKINKSLQKLESGEYGYCDDCGSEIGADRLHARPTADLCISCKTIAEQKETQFKKRRAA